jgi:hypothetical protein
VKIQEYLVSAKKTTSGRMLGFYILFTKIIVEINRLMVEGRGGSKIGQIEGDRQQLEGQGSRLGKV